MDNIFLSGGLSFLITFFAIPVIIQVAKEKRLFDEPDERKIHQVVIPTLGGLGIFAGFVFSILMGVSFGKHPEFQFFIASTIVVFFLGLKDDILIISPSKKFIGQVIAAGILVQFGGIQINSLHGLLGIHTIPHLANLALSVVTIVMIINSFNLIDGIDGLAGALGIISTASFGIYFILVHETAYATMSLAITGSLVAFLIFNFPPAKIFMGDTGSLLLGLVNSILVIKFIAIASAGNHSISFHSAPAIGFSILMIPLFDTIRVFSLRILNRRSPFSPDRNHIHHFLLDAGFSHQQATLICVLTNLLFIGIALFFDGLGVNYVFLILIGVGTIFMWSIYLLKNKNQKIDSKMAGIKNETTSSHRFLSTKNEVLEVD
jgi:UDP-N-acetylmuramyl pentapeptide phosphotransferase/UDP-N-acetylglucosamine-1-phosphate transferase